MSKIIKFNEMIQSKMTKEEWESKSFEELKELYDKYGKESYEMWSKLPEEIQKYVMGSGYYDISGLPNANVKFKYNPKKLGVYFNVDSKIPKEYVPTLEKAMLSEYVSMEIKGKPKFTFPRRAI
jgi:hypothetical protein